MAYTTVSLGYSTVASDTTPSTTPASLQSLTSIHNTLGAAQAIGPYIYIDGTARGFSGNLIYESEIDLFPGQGVFDFSAAGIAASRNLDLWVKNEPKWLKSDDATWTDRLGTGWIKVVLDSRYTLEKVGSMNHYKFKVRAAATVALT